mmetsp:Transcript_9070/g.22340  ORF Transcript_9070/g.22340 Transcript_9070/m.22340 type:complete len:328 (-) Transcript_9070:768-1751(-)
MNQALLRRRRPATVSGSLAPSASKICTHSFLPRSRLPFDTISSATLMAPEASPAKTRRRVSLCRASSAASLSLTAAAATTSARSASISVSNPSASFFSPLASDANDRTPASMALAMSSVRAAAAPISSGSVKLLSTIFRAIITISRAPSRSGGDASSAQRATPAYALALVAGPAAVPAASTCENARAASSFAEGSPPSSAANAPATSTTGSCTGAAVVSGPSLPARSTPKDAPGDAPGTPAPDPAAAATALSTNAASWSSGITPLKVSTKRPCTMAMTVGSDWIRSWSEIAGCASTFILTRAAAPFVCRTSASIFGVSTLQGPHQSA